VEIGKRTSELISVLEEIFFRKGEIFRGKKYYHHQYEKCDDHFVASFGDVLPKRIENNHAKKLGML